MAEKLRRLSLPQRKTSVIGQRWSVGSSNQNSASKEVPYPLRRPARRNILRVWPSVTSSLRSLCFLIFSCPEAYVIAKLVCHDRGEAHLRTAGQAGAAFYGNLYGRDLAFKAPTA